MPQKNKKPWSSKSQNFKKLQAEFEMIRNFLIELKTFLPKNSWNQKSEIRYDPFILSNDIRAHLVSFFCVWDALNLHCVSRFRKFPKKLWAYWSAKNKKLEPKNLRNLRNFEAENSPFLKKPQLKIHFLVSYKNIYVV